MQPEWLIVKEPTVTFSTGIYIYPRGRRGALETNMVTKWFYEFMSFLISHCNHIFNSKLSFFERTEFFGL